MGKSVVDFRVSIKMPHRLKAMGTRHIKKDK